MANASAVRIPRKRRSLLRTLGWLILFFLLLVVVAYFVVTSGSFLKKYVLPQVSQKLKAEITVSDLSVSPFSSIKLKDLKVQPNGQKEPLITAKEFRARYSLWSILRDDIKVDEITLDSPVVVVVKGPDGKSNLDSFLDLPKGESKSENDSSSKVPRVAIKAVNITHGTFRLIETRADGSKETSELSGVKASIQNVQNGQSGKLALATLFAQDNSGSTNATNGTLQAQLDGTFAFKLTDDLKPASVQGMSMLRVLRATGGLADLSSLGGDLTCDLGPTNISQLSLKFQRKNDALGSVVVDGPFSMAKMEGKLNVRVLSIDSRVLNLVGAKSGGLDFGKTSISASNQIEIGKGGKSITAIGQILASSVEMIKQDQRTPPVDLQVDYNVAVDNEQKSARIETFTLSGSQNQKQVLSGGLDRAMRIAWGHSAPQTADATLNIVVTDLKLDDWGTFAKELAPAGKLNLALKVVSQRSGKQLNFELGTRVEEFAATLGGSPTKPVAVSFKATGQASDLKKIEIGECKFELGQGQWAILGTADGKFDSELGEGTSLLNFQVSLPRLSQIMGRPDLGANGGLITVRTRATQKGDLQSLVGSIAVAELVNPKSTGRQAPLEAKLQLDASLQKQVLDLRQFQLALTPMSRARNQLDISGKVDLSNAAAQKAGLKVMAEALDLTPYADILLPEKKSSTTVAAVPPPTAPVTTSVQTEPPAMKLPFQNLLVEANIGRIYLRDLDIAGLKATLKVEDGHQISIPLQAAINSNSLNLKMDVDVGVPGYRYDLACNADKIPIAPLVNTFSPNLKGTAKGDLYANIKVRGTGSTGPSLRKNLGADIGLTFTNSEIQLPDDSKLSEIIKVIGLALTPLNVPDLSKQALESANVSVKISDGKINLNPVVIQSQAYTAKTEGAIPIMDEFANSPIPNLPVEFSLSRSLASKARLATPEGTPYVALPPFVTIGGTIDQVETKIDKTGLAKAIGQAAVTGLGLDQKIGGDAGKILQGVLGTPQGTNSTGTATNKPFNPLDIFKK